MVLTINAARTLVEAAMSALGHTPAESAVIADHLMDCELRGLQYGGLPRALSIAERIQATKTPRFPIRLVKETPVSATFDGGDQVGYLVADKVTDLAISKAQTSGIAVVGAYETWYTGMFSYYLERVTRAGFVGLCAGSGGQIVAPHGGTQGRFGTNPIAFGFPSTESPVIWDIGTSSITFAEVLVAMREGKPLPEGRAFDGEGNPTQNPASALSGALTVWGGHRGSGLAIVVQLLGMLCGAAAAPNGLRDCGFLLIAIDPEILTSGQDFKQQVAAYAQSLRATRPVDASQPVRVPFDRSEAKRAAERTKDQIYVADPVYELLQKVATTSTPA